MKVLLTATVRVLVDVEKHEDLRDIAIVENAISAGEFICDHYEFQHGSGLMWFPSDMTAKANYVQTFMLDHRK